MEIAKILQGKSEKYRDILECIISLKAFSMPLLMFELLAQWHTFVWKLNPLLYKKYIFNVMKEEGKCYEHMAWRCCNLHKSISPNIFHNVSRMHIKSISTKRNHFEEMKENIYCHSKCAEWKTQTQQKEGKH